MRQEELHLKRDAQVAQENHQKDMTISRQRHNQQMSLFNAFQQQQQQQM